MATTKKASFWKKAATTSNALKCLYLLRVLVTLAPSNGYIHPDEFFQSTEPMAVHLANWKGNLTWEWTQERPLRNALIPYVLGSLVFKPLKLFYQNQAPPAYLLLVLPRLTFTLLSFISDFTLRSIHTSGRFTHIQSTLLLHASSHVVFAYLTRTFSNSIEYLLFGWLLILLIQSNRVKSTRVTSGKEIVLLATICTFGIWARPTFAFYAFYPIVFWCTQQCRAQRRLWTNLQLACSRAFKLSMVAIPMAISLTLSDTLFYKPHVIRKLVNIYILKISIEIIKKINFCNFHLNYLAD